MNSSHWWHPFVMFWAPVVILFSIIAFSYRPRRKKKPSQPSSERYLVEKLKTLTYPRPLKTFFDPPYRCPNCGCVDFKTWQDGGHEFACQCTNCKKAYGVQGPPFNLIEEIGGGPLGPSS